MVVASKTGTIKTHAFVDVSHAHFVFSHRKGIVERNTDGKEKETKYYALISLIQACTVNEQLNLKRSSLCGTVCDCVAHSYFVVLVSLDYYNYNYYSRHAFVIVPFRISIICVSMRA